MGYLYSKPINFMLSPSLIDHSIIEDADGNKIDLNNLNSTELNNNIIKCLSKRIDFLENRVDFLVENQKKILKLFLDKKERNKRNLYPDRINSSVRKK